MVLPVINIGSKLDAKGFKQAESATDKLGKNVKKLAGALGLAFGTAQVIAFGKASLKAFSEDEKAAARLTKAVENLGLGFEDDRIKGFISRLEESASVSDDVLRPAFQSLLQTTGSVAKSQELLKLALDVSAGSGVDAAEVSKDLSLAYLGQTKGLSKYNTGLTKAELNTASFTKLQTVLNEQFGGQNAARLETYAGKMDAINIALGNAQETIGKGLVNSFTLLAGDNGIGGATNAIDEFAQKTSDALYGVSVLIDKVNTKFGKFGGRSLSEILYAAFGGGFVDAAAIIGNAELIKPKPFTTPMTITGSTDAEAKAAAARKKAELEAKKRALELLKIKNQQLASEKKALEAKKLAAAIDKANILLGKGQDTFDLDKIQVAAALTNQAEQLGRVTNSAQVLQIANDTARLRVKQSIAALEDAIAAKDEAAIIRATAKLNEDLKILGALSGQNVKLQDIQSILDSLKPKDLINITNLDDALAKIREMLALLGQANTASKAKVPTSGSLGSGIPAGDYIAPVSKDVASKGSIAAILEYADAATERANAFALLQEQQNYADMLALIEYQKIVGDLGGYSPNMNSGRGYGGSGVTITVNTGVGDPNAIAEAISQVVQDAVDRGTLRGGVY